MVTSVHEENNLYSLAYCINILNTVVLKKILQQLYCHQFKNITSKTFPAFFFAGGKIDHSSRQKKSEEGRREGFWEETFPENLPARV